VSLDHGGRALSAPLEFTAEQRQMIRDTFANGATDAEFAVLMEIARTRRLNPLLRQIHFVSRWDSEKRRNVWAPQVSIDGLRAIAGRTGLYAGQDEAEFVEGPDGTLKLCKVRVYRQDWQRPVVGVAYWDEYVQTFRDKQTGVTRPSPMWARMPHVMLAKVAEAVALRRAFPEDMAGLYSTDEMAQAQGDEVSERAPRKLPAPPPDPEANAERAAIQAEPALPAALDGFYARVGEIELPGEAVAVWLKHRAELASLPSQDRERAWKALCGKTEEVGRMKNAKVWLK
jgi:phage recombination protein Bet